MKLLSVPPVYSTVIATFSNYILERFLLLYLLINPQFSNHHTHNTYPPARKKVS